jgi:hypothetical protein
VENADKASPFKEPDEPQAIPMMVALFDVLGFSNRVQRDGIAKIHALYNDLIQKAVFSDGMLCVGTHRFNDGTACPTVFTFSCGFAYFSDTILLWSPLQQMYVGPFLQRCANLMCEALLVGVPLRGAVALGEAVMHRRSSTYLGDPLVEAARLESGQDWIGFAFGYSAHWHGYLAELNPRQIIEYDPPMKASYKGDPSCICLDWPRTWRDKHGKCASHTLKELNTDPTFSKYYDHAIAFCEHSERNKDWHEQPNPKARLRMGPHPADLKSKQKAGG